MVKWASEGSEQDINSLQETQKLLQKEIESLFKVASLSGHLQKKKNKQGKSGAGRATMGPVSQSSCWDVVLLLSSSSPLSPSGFPGQWDDMLKVGLHLASYLNRAATSREHGLLPDCRLIRELLGWPSVPVGGLGKRAEPCSATLPLRSLEKTNTPPPR